MRVIKTIYYKRLFLNFYAHLLVMSSNIFGSESKLIKQQQGVRGGRDVIFYR